MRLRLHLALIAAMVFVVAAFLPGLASTAHAQVFSVVVVSDELNVRSAPNTSAPIMTVLENGDVVAVFGKVAGEEVIAGNTTWFRTKSGWFIYSGLTRPARASGDSSPVSTSGMTGRWIEVDLGSQVAKAIEDGQVVRTALITVGTPAFPTPIGTFAINRRVANETMDSRTVGIPLDSPSGYYLTGVLYTQYFEDGAAIHYNYWSPPAAFGNSPGSHGCVGMMLGDARFFWDFADIGTPVVINP